jgi:hypothetical protein
MAAKKVVKATKVDMTGVPLLNDNDRDMLPSLWNLKLRIRNVL